MKNNALLLLHGYPFDHTLWQPVIQALSASSKIIAPDLRGFGGTTVSAEEPSLDWMARDVIERLDRDHLTSVVVAGFSMGGYVALALAERYPDRVAGFGLINSQTLADSEETRAARRSMIEKVRREGPSAAVDAALPKMFNSSNAQRPELVKVVRRGAEQAGVAGITWALEAMARRPDRTPVLEKLQVPILTFHTAEDKFIPLERVREVAGRLPPTRHIRVELPGLGHCSPLEAPESVAWALKELLTRC
jgi:pimeloyl-ACP methyl ester carboxylesterase